MVVEEISHQACQKLRFHCPECGSDLLSELLEVHFKIQNGVGVGVRDQWETPLPSRKTVDVSDLFTKRDGTLGLTR